eukprot:COSAG06_NODE_5477_length_3455_cov_29.898391_4_plen_58_part_00
MFMTNQFGWTIQCLSRLLNIKIQTIVCTRCVSRAMILLDIYYVLNVYFKIYIYVVNT